MKQMKLLHKTLLFIFIPMIILSIIVVSVFKVLYEDSLIAEKKVGLMAETKIAKNHVDRIIQKYKSKEISFEVAKKSIVEDYSNFTYNDEGDYFFIFDFESLTIAHINKKLLGKSLKELKSSTGAFVINDMADIVKKDGSGYYEYLWASKTDPEKQVLKLSYVTKIEGVDWFIGTGVYIEELQAKVWRQVAYIGGFIFVAFALIFAAISLFLSKSVVGPIQQVSKRLGRSTDEVTNSSDKMLQTSDSLANSSHQQSASLQETVASVDQINAMIANNASSAKESENTSGVSKNAAETGMQVVNDMIQSIKDIKTGNESLTTRIAESNRKIGEILDFIKEIGEKTKVINDIVFQTKLLSFNASVEAARAGEHGKGFAVVAEEVGNLAAMSGKAAEEISSLLETSISNVENIVKETTQEVDRIVNESTGMIDRGIETANSSYESLEQIVTNVNLVNDKVKEISMASNEQSQGVQEITKAMGQLDVVTKQNSDSAVEASDLAKTLKDEADDLRRIMSDLDALVEGRKAA